MVCDQQSLEGGLNMPPVFFALAAAAGFFAAARAIASMMGAAPPDPIQPGETHAQATGSDSARDLGKLEWDATAGVYRPKA
jgi:hypothetical protein